MPPCRSIQNPANVPPPTANPFTVAPEYNTCNPILLGSAQFEFHTEWSDGNAHAAGFTTAWPPNKKIMGTASWNLGLDLDVNGINQESGGPTFAAITSRSYHPGGVNVLMGDGSVRFVKSTINGMDLAGTGDDRRRRGGRRHRLLIEWRRGNASHRVLWRIVPT